MQAIIMAGGKGTRLRPIIDNIPKPLVSLHNKTLLDHIINHAKINGCDNVIICTGYMGEKIQEHITQQEYGISVIFSQENQPLGTAGALHLVKNRLENDFFILYGDVYTTINLKKMLEFHKKKKSDATLALHTSDHPQDSTVVTIDKNNFLQGFVEKPGENWEKYGNLTTTPLYIVKKNIIDFIPEHTMSDFAKDIFPLMLSKHKRLFGYITEEYAKDIGTPERYTAVLAMLQKHASSDKIKV